MKWTRITKDGKRYSQESYCFWDSFSQNSDCEAIEYYCPTNLPEGLVEFWVEFLRSFLTTQKWEYKFNAATKIVTYKLYTCNSRARNVCYLSLFRYIDQFPLIVRRLCSRQFQASAEERFKTFQEISHLVIERKDNEIMEAGYLRHFESYSVIYYGSYVSISATSSKTPITIDDFHFNIKDKSIIYTSRLFGAPVGKPKEQPKLVVETPQQNAAVEVDPPVVAAAAV